MLQKLKQRLKNQRGMTLVELLAVIVILGIISAIAVPSIGNVIEKSKDKAKIAEALQIIDAAKLAYAEDNSVTHWKKDADTSGDIKYGALKSYISKVNNNSYVVTYDIANNIYIIANSDAQTVTGVDANGSGNLTEDELAAAAR